MCKKDSKKTPRDEKKIASLRYYYTRYAPLPVSGNETKKSAYYIHLNFRLDITTATDRQPVVWERP